MSIDKKIFLERIYSDYENNSLDYKRSMPWEGNSRYKLLKSIMAICNHGGGYIVVGYDEKATDNYTGILEEHCESWNTTKVNNLLSNHCSPTIDIDIVFIPDDNKNIQFLVIDIPCHRKTPVLCKKTKDNENNACILKKAALYIRRDVASVEISSYEDYHELIRRCVLNDRKRLLAEISEILSIPETSEKIFAQETNPFEFMDQNRKNI